MAEIWPWLRREPQIQGNEHDRSTHDWHANEVSHQDHSSNRVQIATNPRFHEWLFFSGALRPLGAFSTSQVGAPNANRHATIGLPAMVTPEQQSSSGTDHLESPTAPDNLDRNFKGGIDSKAIGTYTERCLTLLSESSIRLSQLQCSKHRAQHSGKATTKLIDDDATFASVASWLLLHSGDPNSSHWRHIDRENHTVQRSPPNQQASGTLLYQLFSESHILLNTLHLIIQSAAESGSDSTPAHSSASLADTNGPVDNSNRITRFHPSRPQLSFTDCVVRYLVIACHVMLLRAYRSTLRILLDEASPDDHTEASTLGNIRLALITQLCSYLIHRHDKVMGTYLSTHNIGQSFPDLATEGGYPTGSCQS